jgi:predicted ester cyclase
MRVATETVVGDGETSIGERHKAVVRAYIEAFNRGDLAALRALFTPDAQVYGVLGWGGLPEVEPIWRDLHAAFGIQLTAEQMIAEGDTVAVRYTERGTFVAPFRGQPPTGTSFELVAMEWFVMQDGKIHRRWGARDAASQARQLGMPLK